MDFEDLESIVTRWCSASQAATRPSDEEKAESLKRLKSYGKLSDQNVQLISQAIWKELSSNNSNVWPCIMELRQCRVL
jgi:hypothetical protein